MTFDIRSAQYLATVLSDLHSVWQPHAGQIDVGRALFYEGKRRCMVRCGRKWGKTEMSIYTLYRWALTTPNGQFYYIAPFYNQAAELIWKPRRLQDFLLKVDPQTNKTIDLRSRYIESISESDRRVTLKNGSFIKLLGSDNFEAGRGINPDGGVYDEFKDHDYRFHQGFSDNLLAKKAPLLIVGTPPELFDHFFVRTEEDFKQDVRGAYFKKPTHNNPYIDKEELELEKASAIAKGEWAKYMREIEAEIVPGGANAIFPMLDIPRYDEKGQFLSESRHVKKYDGLYERVSRSYRDWDFHACYDPGSAVCFAIIFAAVNRFTREVVILDEIYETRKAETSTRTIYPRAIQKMNQICDRVTWTETYDYAAAWFQNEVQVEYARGLMPCTKDIGKKEVKLSVIKDFLIEDRIQFTDKCPKLLGEMATYATDEHGKIPKKNDHAIDCLRYLFNAAHLNTNDRARKQFDPDQRIWTTELDDEFEISDNSIDMYSDITDELYE